MYSTCKSSLDYTYVCHLLTNLCHRSESVLTRIPIFASFVGRLVNTPLMVCSRSGWRVYMPTFLGVMLTMVEWLRTNGTANNKRVHSFCWFLPNPFIEHLLLCQTSQGFVKTDLYPLYRGLLIYMYVGDTIFSTVCWSMCCPLIGAWQRSNCTGEKTTNKNTNH